MNISKIGMSEYCTAIKLLLDINQNTNKTKNLKGRHGGAVASTAASQ